ncbi:hypothetical protein SAMN05421753_101190 [Planctomicrobium piriforme]|uniref:Uncharacterized protein n=1 Tax=Planctomicrobium piriforme TaxID=1576369 RepID=A0A1I3B296_9PLAN|nr:hypothetical protein SAMN05421753_101190 [Planctomicrobium piriforme]
MKENFEIRSTKSETIFRTTNRTNDTNNSFNGASVTDLRPEAKVAK